MTSPPAIPQQASEVSSLISAQGILRAEVEMLALGAAGAVLVDRRTGTSYAIGQGEQRLIELLASDRSLDEIVTDFQAQTDHAVSRRHVLEFVEHLRRLEMLQDNALLAANAEGLLQSTVPGPGRSGRLNLVIDVLTLLFGWIDHVTVVAAIGVAALIGINIVARHATSILQDMEAFGRVCPFWIWIPFVEYPKLLILNLLFTLVLGIVARGRGAAIRRFELHLWQGVLPIFHLDLGASFALLSRRDRRALVWTSLLFPLAAGSLALIGWRMGRPGSSGSIACLLFAPASLIWFLVQASPLTRGSSGHLLLCDLTREEDFQSWAQDETAAWLLGRPYPRPLTARERCWFRLYGLAYWLYRLALNVATLLIAWHVVFPRYRGPGAICVLIVLGYFNYDLLSNLTRLLKRSVARAFLAP